MPWFDNTSKVTLQPRMSIRVSGAPNGYNYGPTIYAQGVIAGNGTPLDQAKINATDGADVLKSIVRLSDMMGALNKVHAEQDAKEQELGYMGVWNLQE